MKKLTFDYLNNLKPTYLNKGFPVPKWILFSEVCLKRGYEVYLTRSKSTVSKYIYLKKDNKNIKVRFSNHKPNLYKEDKKDCDFYVGIGNRGVITTERVLQYL